MKCRSYKDKPLCILMAYKRNYSQFSQSTKSGKNAHKILRVKYFISILFSSSNTVGCSGMLNNVLVRVFQMQKACLVYCLFTNIGSFVVQY